jgi:diguanylate cyclase (GGDEF)-like protein/PAS domain S-box-containing protein
MAKGNAMTAIKQLEERLSESEERLKVLLEFSSDWYWEQDSDFRFTVITRKAATEVRFPAEGSIGKTRWELPYVGMTDAQWNQHKALLHARQPFRDLVLKRCDINGAMRISSLSGAPVFDAEGKFKGYKGVGKDITERKLAEQREAMEHAVTRLLAQANDPAAAIPNIIQTICETLEWDYGAFWSMDKHSGSLRQTHTWHVPSIDVADFINGSRQKVATHETMRSVVKGGIIRYSWLTQEPLWITDVTRDPTFRRASLAAKAGLHSAFAFPIMANGQCLGVMEFFNREIRESDASLLQSLRSIGSQIGLYYHRKQLEARQAMEHSITRLLAQSGSPEEAMTKIIQTICETLGWDYGGYWSLDEATQLVTCTASWSAIRLDAGEFRAYIRDKIFDAQNLKIPKKGVGFMRYIWTAGEPVWIANLNDAELSAARAPLAIKAGLHSVFAFPILAGQEVIGALEFFSHSIRQPDEILIDTARSIGIQIGQFCRRKQAEQRIQYLAYYDGLTGLPNRTLFNQRLNHALTQARRNKKNLAVLFIDLDRFKNINDTLGHEAGDHLLQEMAKRFKACLRESDTVARLGGDEFVVLLEHIADPKHASNVARKILGAALSPFAIADGEYHVTASVGISIYPEDGEDDQTLMKHADIAMYLAKDQGKNNYQFYSTQINVHSFERLALESSLRRALERREFSLHYQAKVDLKSGCVTGMEALLRWNHPDLGMVSPALFIPLAEETGLIVAIGRWVINEACAQNKAWQEQGLPALSVSVNLSARQFNDDSLVRDVAQALEQSGLAPQYLELEITESMVMYNPDKAVKLLSELKAMGISVAIDDFGIGYSSLSQLKRFPIDTIKIDRSFIKDLIESKEDAAITGAIIAMGTTLSLNVIAEGVETDAQVGFLKAHQCNEMQGYYFSKPIPSDEFTQLLRSGKTMARE